jgi:hypothetical protein
LAPLEHGTRREAVTRVTHPRLLLLQLSVLAACDGAIMSGPTGAGSTNPRVPAPTVTPAPAQLRLLSGVEYRNTVKDLLELDASPAISHADWSGGFDTGAHGQLQEALFLTLADEAMALSQRAVATTLPARFPCLRATLPDACVRAVLSDLARRAFRRPPTPARIDELVAFFQDSTALAGSRGAALELTVARLLLAPEFLYRAEVGRPGADGRRRLDAFERASFISYTLTGSMPDEALLADAERDALDEATARAHVKRLWKTPRARARIAAMFRQWLKATALDDMVSRPQDFPKLASPEQGLALRDGFDGYVTSVAFDGKGTLRALLSESFAMVNQHTAPLVGETVAGDALVRVELPSSSRRGVLTQPALLAALGASGDADRDRPVLRGYLVKTQLLCEPIGPPSGLNTAVAANTAATVPGFAQLTTRQQYEAMMEQGAACSACHAQFMPLGFAFGRYDALGRFRTTQRGRVVDASATGVPFLGETRDFSDGLELTDALAGHEAVAACFTRHLVAWATGLGSAEPAASLATSVSWARGDAPLEFARTIEDVLVHPASAERVVVAEAPVTGGGAAGPGADGGVDAGVAVPSDGGVDAGVPVAAELLLPSGVELRPNESRSAFNGALTLVYQGDGNLVLYRGRAALWSSRTNGQPAHLAAMQGDGNLVVYARPGGPVFASGTNGNPGARLFVESTGRLVIRAVDGRELLATPVPQGATR